MNATRTTKITFKKSESRFIRAAGERIVFCRDCEAQNPHFPVIQIAALLGISEKSLFRLVENGTLHSVETLEGWLLICGSCAGQVCDIRSQDDQALTRGEKR